MDGTQSETKPLTHRLTARKQLLIVLGLVGLVLVSGVVVAQVPSNVTSESAWDVWDDFEDGNSDTFGGNFEIVENSYEDTYSVNYDDSGGNQPSNVNVDWTSQDSNGEASVYFRVDADNVDIGFGSNVGETGDYIALTIQTGDVMLNERISGTTETRGTHSISEGEFYNYYWEVSNGNHMDVYIWDPANQPPQSPQISSDIQLTEADGNIYTDTTGAESETYIDEIGNEAVPDSGFDGYVLTADGDPIDGASVNVSQGGSEVANTTTNETGWYIVNADTGDYNISASKSGYIKGSHTNLAVTEGDFTRQNFTLTSVNESLTLDTRRFLRHGASMPYSVTFATDRTASGNLQRRDVTDDDSNLSMTSVDPTNLSVHTANNTLVAANDSSVNKQIRVWANYSWDGDKYNQSQLITVANVTVDNFGILPPWGRFEATISPGTDANPNDHSFMLIMIATMAAVAATLLASTFAGLGAFSIIIVAGWLIGMTTAGLMLVVLTVVGFAGLNLAANIDYAVT